MILNEYPSGLMTKSMTGNWCYIRFPPNLDSGMLLANYRPFFSSFVIPLLGKVLSSYRREPQRNVLFAQNWGQIFRRSVEVRKFVRIQKVIWDHLLASKKEVSFSFACRTPGGGWLSPCYVVCSVFFCHACVTSLRMSVWVGTVEQGN